jgi:hypothetical protein
VTPLLERPVYRTRQFIGSLRPKIEESERLETELLLGPKLWALFESMSKRDQRHSLDVYRKLTEQGHSDPDLLMASLLHDSGKSLLAGARVKLWHRVTYVVLDTGAPWLLRRLATREGGFAALSQHAERGARIADELGAPTAVVELIQRHEDAHPPDERQRLLRLADDSC